MKIGDKIRELRSIKEVTQAEVAHKTGLSRSVFSQYENNLVDPSAYAVKKMAEYFDVSADYLLGLEDDFGARVAAPMGESLTASEKELLSNFRQLSPYLQGIALNTVRGLTGAGAGDLHKKA